MYSYFSPSKPAQAKPKHRLQLQPGPTLLHLQASAELQHGHHRAAEFLSLKAEDLRERCAVEVQL